MEYFILDTAEKHDIKQIDDLYTTLIRGEANGEPNHKISAFLKELHSKYPHDTALYNDPNLKDYPWKSSDYEISDNALVLSLSSRASFLEVRDFIKMLCRKFGLLLYDPLDSNWIVNSKQ